MDASQGDSPIINSTIKCPICHQVSRALVLPDNAPEYVLWCADGHVVVRTFDEKTNLVFDFAKYPREA